MSVTPKTRVRIAPNVFSRAFDGEIVVLDLERGEYFGLDEVGSDVWAQLSTGRSLEEVIFTVVEKYDVEASRASADTVTLLEELLRRGLVVMEDAG